MGSLHVCVTDTTKMLVHLLFVLLSVSTCVKHVLGWISICYILINKTKNSKMQILYYTNIFNIALGMVVELQKYVLVDIEED